MPTEPPTRYGLVTLEDVNPDPRIVEVNLVADESEWDTGKGILPGLAYNRSTPGPLLEANLGDRIIVHFENRLHWETTIHWHGLRVASNMDGNPMVSGTIPPGGRFDYELEAKEVGLFWYHPHSHEFAQIDLGLYGPILIHGPRDPKLTLDQPLLIDDVLLGDDGKIAGLDRDAVKAEDTFKDSDGQTTERYGNTLLANGRRDFTVPVRAGTWALFRIVNTSNARFLRLTLEGHRFVVVGVDGGFLKQTYETDSLLIGVGERYQVLVHMTGDPGKRYAFKHARGPDDPFDFDPLQRGPLDVAWLAYTDAARSAEEKPILPTDDVPDFALKSTTDYTWTLSNITVDGRPMNAINGKVWPNVDTPMFTRNGDYQFVIHNIDSGPHPFHIHGNRFQVVDVDGKGSPLTGWKDTFDVRSGSRVTLRGRLDNPGHWMVHCHILHHMEQGMMATLMVMD